MATISISDPERLHERILDIHKQSRRIEKYPTEDEEDDYELKEETKEYNYRDNETNRFQVATITADISLAKGRTLMTEISSNSDHYSASIGVLSNIEEDFLNFTNTFPKEYDKVIQAQLKYKTKLAEERGFNEQKQELLRCYSISPGGTILMKRENNPFPEYEIALSETVNPNNKFLTASCGGNGLQQRSILRKDDFKKTIEELEDIANILFEHILQETMPKNTIRPISFNGFS